MSSIGSWFYTSICPNQTRSDTVWHFDITRKNIFLYWLPPVKLYFRPDHSDLAEPSSFHIRQVSAGAELFQVIPKYDKPLCNGALICVWIDSWQVIAGVEHFQIIQNFDSWENFICNRASNYFVCLLNIVPVSDKVNRTISVELICKIQFLLLEIIFWSKFSYHVEETNFAKRSKEVLEDSHIASNWFSIAML